MHMAIVPSPVLSKPSVLLEHLVHLFVSGRRQPSQLPAVLTALWAEMVNPTLASASLTE